MKCNSRENTLEYLKDKKAITQRNTILNANKFNIEMDKIATLAENKYAIYEGNPFTVQRGKLIPRDEFFDEIDKLNEIGNEEVDNIFTYENTVEEAPEEPIDEDTLTEEEKQELLESTHHNAKLENIEKKKTAIAERYVGVSPFLRKADELAYKIAEHLEVITKSRDKKDKLFKTQATTSLKKLKKVLYKAADKSMPRRIETIDKANYYKSILIFYDALVNQSKIAKEKVDKEVANPNRSVISKMKTYNLVDAYVNSFDIVKDVQDVVSDLARDTVDPIISPTEAEQLSAQFGEIIKEAEQLKSTLSSIRDDILVAKLGNSMFYKDELIKIKANAERKASKLFGNKSADKAKRNNFVRDFMFKNKKIIEERTKKEFRKLLENNQYDISNISSNVISDANIANAFIQIGNVLTNKSENRWKNNVIKKIVHLNNLQKGGDPAALDAFSESYFKQRGLSREEYAKVYEKGGNMTRENWKNITEQDHKGNYFLKSTYKAEYYSRLQELQRNIRIAGELSSEKKAEALEAKAKFLEENSTTYKGTKTPISKWKNDLSKLSLKEKVFLEEFKMITKESHIVMGGRMSLYHKNLRGHNAMFFELPKMLETNFSKLQRGDLPGGIKKTYTSLFKKEADDVLEGQSVQLTKKDGKEIWEDIESVDLDLSGKDKTLLNINYRNNVFDNQNLDLLTVYIKEIENSEKYAANKEIEEVYMLLEDAIKHKNFYKTKGMSKMLLLNKHKDISLKNFEEISGENSQVYKKFISMKENNIYEITSKYAGTTMGNIDINRLTGSFIAYSSYIGMAIKIPGAINNFFIGTVNNMIEQLGGEIADTKDGLVAHKMYSKNFGGIIADIGSPFKTNIVNQILSVYDVFGDYSQLNNQYERNNKAKQLFESSTLFGFYSSGEHEIQGTLALTMLQGIKVLNRDGKYVNKEGKQVKDKKDAASLLDMYYKDKSGTLQIKTNLFSYTTVDYLNKFDNGGQVAVRTLIKDRIFRTQGIYDVKRQSDWQRNFYGKLFLHYKKYFEPAVLNRFRGMGNVLKETEDLKDHQKYYNYATSAEEYGYFTTFIRRVAGAIKKQQFDVMGKNSALTEHEIANMKKATRELGIITAMITLAASFAMAAASNDDDDMLWTAAYFARRQQNELLQYFLPIEMIRIAKNPIASFAQLSALSRLLGVVVPPYGEKYKSGDNKGEYKDWMALKRATLPKSSFLGYDVQYKKMYNFFDSLD